MILVVTPNPCLDRTLFVRKNRPGGRMEVEWVQEIAGGKGSNVCRVLRELGYPAVHLLFLGGYVGERVLALLEEDGIESVPVWTRALTRVVVTVVDREWHQTVYFDPSPAVTPEEEVVFLEKFTELQEKAEMVLLCGSVPASLPFFYDKILERTPGKRVVIDGRGPVLRSLKHYPWGIKMNRDEAVFTWGEKLKILEDWERFFGFFCERGVEMVVLTLGERGAIVKTTAGFYRVSSIPVAVVNPVGSGDAFLGGLVYGMVSSFPVEESLRWAVAAGASNALVWEAGRVDRAQVETLKAQVKVEEGMTLREFGVEWVE